jgi:hypothetical protein
MLKRYIFIVFSIFLLMASPSFARSSSSSGSESWTVGGGYWTMPNVDDDEGKLDTSGFYGSLAMKSTNYMIEGDYALTGSKFICISADYIYPLGQDTAGLSNTFIGAGYTYFAGDDFDNAKGFNAVAGASFGNSMAGQIRYDFLGNSQEMFTLGVTYAF